MHTARGALAVVAAVMLAACAGGDDGDRVLEAPLADGTYRVVYGDGFAPGDEPRILAVTARLDRAQGLLVLTLADGSQQARAFAPRPREQWQAGCATMGGHTANEVADLSPAPLVVESLRFETPVAFAMCSPRRMILADTPDAPVAPWLALDLQ